MNSYSQAMTDRAMLPKPVRVALQAAMQQLVDELGSQTAASVALGISQPAVQKAIARAEVGPAIERKVREYFALADETALLARFGGAVEESAAPLEIDSTDPIPERAHASALAQHAGADPRAIAWARSLSVQGQPPVWWLTRIIAKHGELALLTNPMAAATTLAGKFPPKR